MVPVGMDCRRVFGTDEAAGVAADEALGMWTESGEYRDG